MTVDDAAEAADQSNREVAHGITEIHLHSTEIELLHRFYGQDLGLPTTKQGHELAVEAGQSRIVFEPGVKADEEPFYHVAFNIPENKLERARRWQKKRTPLIKRGENEVIHLAHWNAHSVFFNDPAGNILEYIARHDLNNAAAGDFSTSDILYASEIGLVVDDVAETVAAVRRQLGLPIYRDNSRYFASLGDEHSLLIVVKRDRRWTPDRVRPAKVFPVVAAIQGLKTGSLTMDQFGYKITSEPRLTEAQRGFMSDAIAEARSSFASGGVPLGCVVVKDSRIIGRGHNRRIQDSDPIMHADLSALRHALREQGSEACRGATAYVTAMPCKMCAASLAYWGVKEVVACRVDGYPDNRPFLASLGVRLVEVEFDAPKQLLQEYRRNTE